MFITFRVQRIKVSIQDTREKCDNLLAFEGRVASRNIKLKKQINAAE